MQLLLAIWSLSLIMANGALACVAGLIVARIWRRRTQTRRDIARRRIVAAYLAILQGETGGGVAELRPCLHLAHLLGETFLEFADLLRGDERDRLVAALTDLGVDAQFRAGLAHGSLERRVAFAEALAAFPSEDTRRALERQTRARDGELRLAAFRGLIDQGARISIEALVGAMSAGGETPSGRYASLLRQLAPDRAAELATALETSPLAASGRAMLAEALGYAGDYAIGPRLAAAASDADAAVRAAAVRGLGRLGQPIASPAIRAALDDPDRSVRAEALDAAAMLGLKDLVPRVVSRLGDEAWHVRLRAAEALATLDRKGPRALEHAGGSPVEGIRRATAMASAERRAA